MIVKDEEHTLERCLSSVLPWIDYYVVCDTGSCDRTVDIVKETLAERKGLIYDIDFKNFQQARNQALELARQCQYDFDYFLFIDADMELKVLDKTFKSRLEADAFELEQRSDTVCYSNVRLLKRSVVASYIGKTHEYLHVQGRTAKLNEVIMLDHACGSSRANKSKRDLALLKSAVDSDPKDARSLFYLAQTLREAKRYHEAIICYNQRIVLGGWDEEVWYSQFMLATCYLALEDLASFTLHCLKAYDLRPTRAEPLYALAKAYRNQKLYQAAARFAELGLAIAKPEDRLFVEHEVYNSLLCLELSISGYYCQSAGLRQAARLFCEELALDRQVPTWVRNEARSNWRFYALSAENLFPTASFYLIDYPLPSGYYPCNPSVVFKDGILWCVLRSVNYFISEKGEFIVQGGEDIVRTQNYLLKLASDFQIISAVPIREVVPRATDNIIEGLEDIRLLPMDGDFLAIATLVAGSPGYRRQLVTFTLNEEGLASDLSLQNYQSHLHQKNWIPFKDSKLYGYIYFTDPLTILRWSKDSGQATPWLSRDSLLALDNLRGSSQAVAFDDGWLYLTHEVSFHHPHRYYLHRFVQLDKSFRLKALSEPFYFRELGVEFCCGMAYHEPREQLILSFGLKDRSAWLMTLSTDDVRACLEAVESNIRRD